jgi:hypothetical protein
LSLITAREIETAQAPLPPVLSIRVVSHVHNRDSPKKSKGPPNSCDHGSFTSPA